MTTKNTASFVAGDALAAAVAGQAAGLHLLLSEMQALTHAMPGISHPMAHLSDAQLAVRDAEVEADFDNMPV